MLKAKEYKECLATARVSWVRQKESPPVRAGELVEAMSFFGELNASLVECAFVLLKTGTGSVKGGAVG